MVFGESGNDAWHFCLQNRVYLGILMPPVLPEKGDGPVQCGQGFLSYGVIGEVRQTNLPRSREQNVANSFVDGTVVVKSLFIQGAVSPTSSF